MAFLCGDTLATFWQQNAVSVIKPLHTARPPLPQLHCEKKRSLRPLAYCQHPFRFYAEQPANDFPSNN